MDIFLLFAHCCKSLETKPPCLKFDMFSCEYWQLPQLHADRIFIIIVHDFWAPGTPCILLRSMLEHSRAH